MGNTSPYNPDAEDAYTAILSRVAWELSGKKSLSLTLETATQTLEPSQTGLRMNHLLKVMMMTTKNTQKKNSSLPK